MTSFEILDELKKSVDRFEALITPRFAHLVGNYHGGLGIEKRGNRIRLIYCPDGEEAKVWGDCSVMSKIKITPEMMKSLWDYLSEKDSQMSKDVKEKITGINSLVDSLENKL